MMFIVNDDDDESEGKKDLWWSFMPPTQHVIVRPVLITAHVQHMCTPRAGQSFKKQGPERNPSYQCTGVAHLHIFLNVTSDRQILK